MPDTKVHSQRPIIVWRGYGMAHAWKKNGLGKIADEAICGVFADDRDRLMEGRDPVCPNCTARWAAWTHRSLEG